jgi:putative sterol carrier protein
MSSIAEFFTGLAAKVDPAKTAGMTAVYQFVINGDGGGQWYAKIADGAVEIASGTAESPSITLTCEAADWQDIVSGKLNGQTAFLTGKLKIKGDMGLAMKLPSLFLAR